MDFKAHILTAWSLTLDYIVPLILITLVLAIVSGLTLGILAPVMLAGYMSSVLLMLKEGREPKIPDLFSKMNLFLPLLVFGVVVLILSILGIMLLVLPGILFILAVSFFCVYTIPLMVDKNMGLVDAIKESIVMVRKDPILDHIIIVILFLGISWVGSFVVIGWLFTQPLATIFLMSAYMEKVKAE
ncbi:MAG: hypothetical protein HKM93_18000 [Desulfobacteraceae bacterium]|nr:hypothetical protein [Desulfobacteraceae bacterium]